MPFDLFPRQEELLRFLNGRLIARSDGIIEKSRDIGFTWVAAGFALHRWIFVPGFKTTFGSRKEEYVDRIGDPDSIFEKIRLLRSNLPPWMLPKGFDPRRHDNHMQILNPENSNTIRGEAGDNMGRGGRSTIYIIDEGAFIERADRVDAATAGNADVRIWASSVNGMGNAFARKRFNAPPEQVFRFHWRDDPRKTEGWARKKQASMEPHLWASEYEIDYAASVEGVCIPAKWVEAATRIASLMPLDPAARGVAGLDVGGGGKGKSVFVARFGPIVRKPVSWGDPDTIETAHRGLDLAVEAKTQRSDGTPAKVRVLKFDSVGIGQGVAAALARHAREGLQALGVNVGEPPSDTRWPDGETSTEKFANLKAELWFLARQAFKATYETVRAIEGDPEATRHPADELISLPTDATELITQLSLPRWFRTEKGKMILETKQQLAQRGIPSPDFAEALILTFGKSGSVWANLADN